MAINTLLPYDVNERNAASRAAQDLATGLEGLMQNRVQKMQQRQQQMNQAKAFSALGIPTDQADLLASADPQTQQLVLKNYLAGAESAGLEQALAGLGGDGGFRGFENTPAQNMSQVLGSLQGQQPNAITQNLLKGLPMAQLAQQPMMQQQAQQPGLTQPQENNLASILQRPRLNPQQRLKIEEMKQRKELAEKKLSAAEQREINQETKETYHSINQAAKAARDGNIRLGRMENLINEGKVQSNVFLRGLKAAEQIKYIGPLFGIIGAAVTNPETQEFEKLSADFVKDAKQFFGSRVTQNEVELFLKTVPTLMQSAEGQKRVIRNMRLFNEAAELRRKTMNNIIKSNGGKRPQDLEGLIEDFAGPRLDALAERFRTGAV